MHSITILVGAFIDIIHNPALHPNPNYSNKLLGYCPGSELCSTLDYLSELDANVSNLRLNGPQLNLLLKSLQLKHLIEPEFSLSRTRPGSATLADRQIKKRE